MRHSPRRPSIEFLKETRLRRSSLPTATALPLCVGLFTVGPLGLDTRCDSGTGEAVWNFTGKMLLTLPSLPLHRVKFFTEDPRNPRSYLPGATAMTSNFKGSRQMRLPGLQGSR